MCCAIGMLIIAAMTAGRRGLKAVKDWRPVARQAAIHAALATVLISGSALAAHHYNHYAMRAQSNERSVLAEILAQPICTTQMAETVIAAMN